MGSSKESCEFQKNQLKNKFQKIDLIQPELIAICSSGAGNFYDLERVVLKNSPVGIALLDIDGLFSLKHCLKKMTQVNLGL